MTTPTWRPFHLQVTARALTVTISVRKKVQKSSCYYVAFLNVNVLALKFWLLRVHLMVCVCYFLVYVRLLLDEAFFSASKGALVSATRSNRGLLRSGLRDPARRAAPSALRL